MHNRINCIQTNEFNCAYIRTLVCIYLNNLSTCMHATCMHVCMCETMLRSCIQWNPFGPEAVCNSEIRDDYLNTYIL